MSEPRPTDSRPTSHSFDLSRVRLGQRVVRTSFAAAGVAAAPYWTTTRIALTQLWRSRAARVGALLLACAALTATFANVLANDLPVACRWQGVLYVLPSVTHPAALRGRDFETLLRDERSGDWTLGPLVAYGPDHVDPRNVLVPPFGRHHPLGTDAFGRDLFARVVHSARTALGLGFAGASVLVALGITLGALAGFAGGLVDALLARAVESLTAIPTLVLVLVIEALVPHATTATLLWTIVLTRWTELARLVRAEVLLVLGSDYVLAARALGASSGRVLWRYVLPNALGPALVAAAFAVASIVLAEAAVDFLRASSPDTLPSWGETLGESRAHMHAWWLLVFPGMALLATLVSLNLIGEAARDSLDPRLRWAPPTGSG